MEAVKNLLSGGVVTITSLFHTAIEFIEVPWFFTICIRVTIKGITIQRITDRVSLADNFFQMNGANVIVVIVPSAAVATEFIQRGMVA